MRRAAPSRRTAAVQVVGPLQWLVLPALAALLATWVLAMPIRLFGLALPEPVFPMVLAFSWPLIRPSLLAPATLFVTGLALDLFWGGALGLWPVCLLAAYAVILFSRPLVLGQDTRVLFGWYLGVVVLAFCIAYVTVTLKFGQPPSVISVLLQVLPTALLFPISSWLLDRFDAGDVRFR